MTTMDTLIRRAAGVTEPSNSWAADTTDDDLAEYITPDADQGRRNITATPPISGTMNTRIRQAAGISVRPRQTSTPEIGEYYNPRLGR